MAEKYEPDYWDKDGKRVRVMENKAKAAAEKPAKPRASE